MINVKTIAPEDIHTLQVKSAMFEANSFIPQKYTCDGLNINPPIDIYNLPVKTRSMVVIMEDPDSPSKTFLHWMVWNMVPSHKIKENNRIGVVGKNDFGSKKYGGPCPATGTHHYHIKVYALDELLDLNDNASRHDLEKAMSEHIIAFGELIGRYKRV